MRSQYENYAGVVADRYNYNNNNNNNNNSNSSYNINNYNDNSAIPYHARENSLPFSYGQITPKLTSSSMTRRNDSYDTLNMIRDVSKSRVGADGAGVGERDDLNFNFDTYNELKRNNMYNVNNNYVTNHHYTNGNSTNFKSNGVIITNNDETDNKMIKPPARLTSPLLVRKTLNPNNPSVAKNTISNTYHYNYGSKDQSSYNDVDSGIDSLLNGIGNGNRSRGVPYVTLNGTLDKSHYNNYNGNNNNNYNTSNGTNSLLRKTPTPRNYEEFEELLRERREKVFNEHGVATSSYLSSTLTNNNNSNYNNNNNSKYNNISNAAHTKNTLKASHKNNYDFEFHLNLNDNDDFIENGVGVKSNGRAPTPPRRHYTLDRMQFSPRNNVERNYHTINTATTTTAAEINRKTSLQPIPQPQSTNTANTLPMGTTYAGAHIQTERYERPPLELDVGYKRHFDILQQQQQQNQWPAYNSKSNQSSSITTTYGNGNMAGYHNNNNNNYNYSHDNMVSNDNFGKQHSWQQADIRTDYNSAPIYASSIKSQQQQQQQYKPTTTATKSILRNYDETDFIRPETPAFPVTPRTPSLAPTLQRETHAETLYQSLARPRVNSMRSISNSELQEVAAHLVKFAKDSSQYWYKANLSREEAISLLLNAAPGTFLVRDSTTYKNAYGLVLRVAQPPPGATATGKPDDLVRHFLIEPTTRGVRLKGCANEPVFTSLSALVYEHSINQLALPCLLRIPEHDLLPPRTEPTPAQRQLMTQGAACNVLYLYSAETESLTGEEAIRKTIRQLYAQKPLPAPTEVHFKVSQQGITLTDNTRKLFFRKHYAPDIISYCAIDPDHRLWTMQDDAGQLKKTIFAFVARRSASSKDNQCHVFCDMVINQPASAIVSFVNKTLPTEHQRNIML